MITELNDNVTFNYAIETINKKISENYYDTIIVGAGITGATIAQQLCERGQDVLVIEKRTHIAGNCYTMNIHGIDVHKYGAHIFRTSKKSIWDYVNKFIHFNTFNHKVVINYDNILYSFPINLLTLNQVYGINVSTPQQAQTKLDSFKNRYPNPQNLKEHCINMIGPELFEMFVKGYTEKQWGVSCEELPADIIKRIPVRTTANDSYFADDKIYQGIPETGGYTKMVENMLEDADVYLGLSFTDLNVDEISDNNIDVIYTGAVDEFMEYSLGTLDWRSLKFDTQYLPDVDTFQATPVVNYPSSDIPYTRIIEHKQFNPQQPATGTVITTEYPEDWLPGEEAYYPINNETNNDLHNDYLEIANTIHPNIIFAGRMGDYRYYDMDVAIEKALDLASQL